MMQTTVPWGRRARSTLANQLVMAFLALFLLILSLISVFAYVGILNILKGNAADSNERQFKQYDYNLSAFAGEVDQLSRQLVLDTDLQSLIDYKALPDVERIYQMGQAFVSFTQLMSNYKYIDSISFYGGDGLLLTSSQERNEIEYDPKAAPNAFYDGNIYNRMLKSGQRVVWFGGYTSANFAITPPKGKAVPYVTAARSLTYDGRIGTLVINVDMSYFNDIYNHASDAGDAKNEMYLVDETGMVVSHSDEAKVGEQAALAELLKKRSGENDSFYSEETDGKQVMYYRTTSFGWTLVNEIPVSAFTKDILTLRKIVITMFILSLIVAAFASRFWIRRVTMPLSKLSTVMKKTELGNIGLTLDLKLNNELGHVINQFNRMSLSIEELLHRTETIEAEKRRLEVGALQSQINPHFFYNTLNTIKWMAIMIKADNIADSITTLSKILHPTFKKKDIYCTVREETDYLQNYIEIMNYRYAGEVKFKVDLAGEEVADYRILRFMLQPLVENAIYHGLNNPNGGEIAITAVRQADVIVLSVADNGAGMTEDKLAETRAAMAKHGGDESGEGGEDERGIGLRNVNRRIELHFGPGYPIAIESRPNEGTILTLTLPFVQKS